MNAYPMIRTLAVRLGATALVAGLAVAPAAAQSASGPQQESATAAPSLGQALTKGTLAIATRYRLEHVDDDAIELTASAPTFRISLGYRTLPYRGLSGLLEFSAVTGTGSAHRYNNAGAGAHSNGVTDRPVVADPAMTQVNQAALVFDRWSTQLSAGRLELSFDDQRFVGPVKWRQSYQTFVAARVENRSISHTTLVYAFLDKAYTVTGGERPMTTHLANVAVHLPVGTVVGYAYLLGFDSEADASLSTSTLGLRFSGRRPAGRLTVGYEGAYAYQRDYASNPTRVRAGYYEALASIGSRKVTLEASYEVLEGSEKDGRFTTPLATLHAFNGWADKFLSTPPFGLADLAVGVHGGAGPVTWRATFHDFASASGGARLGREVDLAAGYETAWKQSLGVKAAFYRADGHSSDATKVWLWSAYAF
jgi:hypothetical protein